MCFCFAFSFVSFLSKGKINLFFVLSFFFFSYFHSFIGFGARYHTKAQPYHWKQSTEEQKIIWNFQCSKWEIALLILFHFISFCIFLSSRLDVLSFVAINACDSSFGANVMFLWFDNDIFVCFPLILSHSLSTNAWRN